VGDDVVLESDLVDVADVDLDRLEELPEPVLHRSLDRLLRDRVDFPARYSIHEAPQ
jgi:FXSXX-COOH protein